MRYLLLGSALCVFMVMPQAFAQDSKSRKFDLAQEYSQMVPFEKEVASSIEQIALQVPVAQRTQFRSILERAIKVDQLKTASEVALVDIFTVEELEALVRFNKTEEGKAIIKKMPLYQKRLQPVLEAMITDAGDKLRQQMLAQ